MPNLVRALSTAGPHQPFVLGTIERRTLGANDVAIDIAYCGICHSDIHQAHADWGAAIFPMVPGHEIAGVVAAVGEEVTRFAVGDRVGVGCFVDSCRECENCVAGEEQYCQRGMVPTYNGRDKQGTPTLGGYSTNIVVDESYVLRLPDGLPLEAAAPLLCAGITVWSPLRYWGAGPGVRVGIIGMGGLGHLAVKLAHAMGAEVTVLSQTLAKREDAVAMGAQHYYATSDPTTFKELAESLDLIVCTVSANLDLDAYLQLLKRNGTLVNVGLPSKPDSYNAFSLVKRRRTIAGSNIGGIRETQELLDFCGEHALTAEVEVIDPQDVEEAYRRVLNSDVRYRFVLDVKKLADNGDESVA
jgi:uncharacterized zinc-type alcohol dehydrogenase-like protein